MRLVTEPLHLLLPLDVSRALDDYRRHVERPPSRPQAALALLRQGLAAAGINVEERAGPGGPGSRDRAERDGRSPQGPA
jgi:hypothetical protein